MAREILRLPLVEENKLVQTLMHEFSMGDFLSTLETWETLIISTTAPWPRRKRR